MSDGEAVRAVVALLDPNPLFADTLAFALCRRGITVHQPARTGWGDVPDAAVILVDGSADQATVGAAVRVAREAVRHATVLLLVSERSRATENLIRKVGAVGSVSRHGTVEDVALAIRAPAARGAIRTQTLKGCSGVPAAPRNSVNDRSPQGLTARELEVLQLVAVGSSDDEVATRLDISVHTVRAHLQRIRAKLGVASRFAAVAAARASGLLDHSGAHVEEMRGRGGPN